MSVVRGFAAYLHALDPVHQVPPKDLLPRQTRQLQQIPHAKVDVGRHARGARYPYGRHSEFFSGFQIGERILDHDAGVGAHAMPAKKFEKPVAVRFRSVAGALDAEYVVEQIRNAERINDRARVMHGCIREYDFAARQPPQGQPQSGLAQNDFLQRRESMRRLQKMARIGRMITHESDQRGAIALPVVPP